MNKTQLEMLILAGDILVERLAHGEILCEIADREYNDDTEMELQQALLDGLDAMRARLKDYEQEQ